MKKFNYGLIVWFILTLFVTYAFCLMTAAAVFANAVKSSLHTTDFAISYATGAFIIAYAGMQLPGGYLLDKFNIKLVVCGSALLLAAGNLLLSFAGDIFSFTYANFLQGIGASCAFIATGVVISRWFLPHEFPILFGLTQTLSGFLTAALHYYFVQELQYLSWNLLYQYLAYCGFLLFLLALFFVKTPSSSEISSNLSFKTTLRLVCENGQIWLCTIAAATSFGILLAYASFWYLKVQTYYAVELTDSLIISGLIFIGIGIGTPLLGWLSNRMKSRKLIIHLSLVLGNMALLLALYLPHFDIEYLVIIKIISFFIGFFLSGSMLFYTIASEISKESTRGTALGMVNTGVFLFNSMMMIIPYFFITKTSQTFFTFLWVLPFSIMIAILASYFIQESYST